jgi:hypothetical protein
MARDRGFHYNTISRMSKKAMSLTDALKSRKTISDMARARGLKPNIIFVRRRNYMSLEEALTRPVRGRKIGNRSDENSTSSTTKSTACSVRAARGTRTRRRPNTKKNESETEATGRARAGRHAVHFSRMAATIRFAEAADAKAKQNQRADGRHVTPKVRKASRIKGPTSVT